MLPVYIITYNRVFDVHAVGSIELTALRHFEPEAEFDAEDLPAVFIIRGEACPVQRWHGAQKLSVAELIGAEVARHSWDSNELGRVEGAGERRPTH